MVPPPLNKLQAPFQTIYVMKLIQIFRNSCSFGVSICHYGYITYVAQEKIYNIVLGSKHLDYSEETGLGYIIGEVTEILNGPGLFILKYSKMNEHRDYRILQKRLNDIYGNKTGNQFSFNQMTKFDAGCYGIYHYKNENYVRAKIIPKQTTDNGQITSSNNAADFKLYLVDLGIQLSTFDNRTIYTYPKQLNSHKNHLKDLLCLPECSFPCFLTGIKPANNSNRYPKIICDRFSDLVGLNKKIAVNIFLPSKKQRSRLDPFMRQKYGGMIPLSIDVKASANGYQVHSTLGTEMQKENSVLLDQSTTFKIDLDQSEKTLIGKILFLFLQGFLSLSIAIFELNSQYTYMYLLRFIWETGAESILPKLFHCLPGIAKRFCC